MNIPPFEFHFVSERLRTFFLSRGLIEVPAQSKLAILASCEDPTTMSSFEYSGQVWPLPQSNQMHLEKEILTSNFKNGVFCATTSYRQESNPVPGRHDLIFPMFEFEIFGGVEELKKFETDILLHFGYKPKHLETKFAEGNYEGIANFYEVEELDHVHEEMLYKDFGPVFFLKDFPVFTSPFWNMKMEKGIAKKVDVILSGMETFGSAERSCNKEEMKNLFHTISEGTYANTLFARFGRTRVEKELEEFLSLDFKPRSGCGIGVTRLIRSLKLEGLLNK